MPLLQLNLAGMINNVNSKLSGYLLTPKSLDIPTTIPYMLDLTAVLWTRTMHKSPPIETLKENTGFTGHKVHQVVELPKIRGLAYGQHLYSA